MVRRIILMVAVALMMALMVALAGAASATIHPLAKMECANENASEVVQTQDPPGLTGQSQGKPPNNPVGGTIAQPVFQASPNALKDEGC
ncbi:MAG TPA: hypothetical protein VK869_11380 [Rubrobacteraceae bacterium]|nr:hypothetical protein [Rubrobacteraceae bacterium]